MSPTDPQDPARAAAREPGEPVLTVRGLRKSFGDTRSSAPSTSRSVAVA